jgi:hypothetical protein
MNNALCYRVLVAVLFGVYVNASQAQTVRPRLIEVGFCAGPTIGWAATQTESYESTGIKVSGYYGLSADVNLVRTKEVVFFSTGILFKHIRFGLNYTDNYFFAKKEENIDSARITSAYNTIFLTIPTAVKFKTDPFSGFAIFGIAGLEHGFRISAKSKDEILRLDDTKEKADKVSQSKNVGLLKESIFAVLGVEYRIFSHTKATFGIGYNYGLNNIFNRKYSNSITNEKMKANIHTIEFQFGFIF